MNVFEKVRGVIGSIFQIGLGGPNLKNVSGVVEARDAADAAFVNVRGLDPLAPQDFATKRYVDDEIGRLLAIAILSASGTFTTGPGTRQILIRGMGGGGGGGGASAGIGQAAVGGGGGAGMYNEAVLSVTPDTSYIFVCGAGGAGGVPGGPGGGGGSSTFTVGVTTIAAPAGFGGAGMTNATAPAVAEGGAEVFKVKYFDKKAPPSSAPDSAYQSSFEVRKPAT